MVYFTVIVNVRWEQLDDNARLLLFVPRYIKWRGIMLSLRLACGRILDGIHKFDHLYLGHHLTNPYGPSYMYVVWTKFCVLCIFWSPPPSVLPGGHKGQLSRFRTITDRKVD